MQFESGVRVIGKIDTWEFFLKDGVLDSVSFTAGITSYFLAMQCFSSEREKSHDWEGKEPAEF